MMMTKLKTCWLMQAIEDLMQANRKSLKHYPPMPYPMNYSPEQQRNRLIAAELTYDRAALEVEFNQLSASLTEPNDGITDTDIPPHLLITDYVDPLEAMIPGDEKEYLSCDTAAVEDGSEIPLSS
ncbi:hypothetical protein L6164_001328 [Bauhinia variegata]|uniref:Uncharacterized protein n=1 Tax=Bauhinia variegata TaxID=167791 RepID=A0ACB9QC04_BAUVA|nr:hypothetical protein L6164_001328 [Bauhinia variegata]